MKREIVHHPGQFGGRWHFEGTSICIDDLHRDFRRGGEAVRSAYLALGLSDDELDKALAFGFPAVGAPSMEPEFVAATIHCACGVRRRVQLVAPDFETDPCICGRVWHAKPHVVPQLRGGTSYDGSLSGGER